MKGSIWSKVVSDQFKQGKKGTKNEWLAKNYVPTYLYLRSIRLEVKWKELDVK
jgi:hypothetical protein